MNFADMNASMTASVVIPTYRRPDDLQRCIIALTQQLHLPSEIITVVRDSDRETQTALETLKTSLNPSVNFRTVLARLKVVIVSEPGQVAALNAGVTAATGDIVAITDDDAVPYPCWLERIIQHFVADPTVGGVGGRDWLYFGKELQDGERETVGRLRWFGARVGNHHLGMGNARSVEVLKGANMSYRRKAIANLRFNENLRGNGAQVHNDLAFSLSVKKAGWKLIYDPQVSINHLAGARFDEDQRHHFNAGAFNNAVHNETLAILNYLPVLNHLYFWFWAILIGNREAFGLVQFLRFLPSEGTLAFQKWCLSISGRWQGYRTWAK
ncbi:MAG: glycosyltransferase family 2 protein [Phormidesmis sp.]